MSADSPDWRRGVAAREAIAAFVSRISASIWTVRDDVEMACRSALDAYDRVMASWSKVEREE